MSTIRQVKLEILRPGPSHNQLLSPLTAYMALCGASGPVTVNMPFEHWQLLSRLARLRYEIDGKEVPRQQRESEIREIGATIGDLFGRIPALLTELGEALGAQNKMVHLRLSLSASELGLIPFEAAHMPEGVAGSGAAMLLESYPAVALTREVRRGRPLPVEWNRPPRILFIFASPAGFAPVPADAHLDALRKALKPWLPIGGTPEARVAKLKTMLRVLPNATLEAVRDACAQERYTHVHVLAHGAPANSGVDTRYGLALCSTRSSDGVDIVEGDRLAGEFIGRESTGSDGHRPTVVTLATCDSGNVGTVLTPGGSIAHQLHATGIPWVIASQFPLWMRSSTIVTQVLYEQLLAGQDPRWAICELRQRLRAEVPETHDWASIVAYATVPWDLEAQVDAFRAAQTRAKLDVRYARIDELVGANRDSETPARVTDPVARDRELAELCAAIRADLKNWSEEPAAKQSNNELAERIGMRAASEKRIAIAFSVLDQDGTVADPTRRNSRILAYDDARRLYREAFKLAPSNHWVLTQYLSIAALPEVAGTAEALEQLASAHRSWWEAARQIARWQFDSATDVDQRAWALGTLAELALLGSVYVGKSFKPESAKSEIDHCCTEMFDLLRPEDFAIQSTRRQFRRYRDFWRRDEWHELCLTALTALKDH